MKMTNFVRSTKRLAGRSKGLCAPIRSQPLKRATLLCLFGLASNFWGNQMMEAVAHQATRDRTLKNYQRWQRRLSAQWRVAESDPEAADPQTLRDFWRWNVPAFADFFFPGHVSIAFSDFHRCMIQEYREQTLDDLETREGQKRAFCAPRGNAKTTIAQICAIHAIVYQLERYIVIFSATQPQATQIVRNIRDELMDNDLLKEFFAPTWGSEGEMAFTCNGVRVEGHGLRTARRGIKWGAVRPTWVILDDVEEDESVLSADQRAKVADRFNRVVEPIGSAATHFWVNGTLLHQQALLAALLKRPDFKTFFFQSIESEPGQEDLWRKWREIYIDLDNERRAEEAHEYYLAQKATMDEGGRVLWPERESLEQLQQMRATLGRFAFNAEKQNDPRDPDSQIFFIDDYPRCRIEGPDVITPSGERKPWAQMQRFTFLDPALGIDNVAKVRKGQRDFAAITTIGIDDKGFVYGLNAWLSKAAPEATIKRMLDIWEVFGGGLGFESVGFQDVLRIPFDAEVRRRKLDKAKGDLYKAPVPFWAFDQHTNKTARIMRLEPMLNNGWIILAENLPSEFWGQLETFPTGAHDDGPDSLEGAIRFAEIRGALRFAG